MESDEVSPGATPMDGNFAFHQQYQVHAQAVFGMAYRLCGAKLAADVTQEVFLAHWAAPDRFDPNRGTLRAFLVTMSHHKAVSLIRSENSRHVREGRFGHCVGAPVDSDHGLIGDERAESVSQALNELPKALRDAIVTAYYGECSYREAALVLGIPEGTIKARIRKGLGLLRLALPRLDTDEGEPSGKSGRSAIV